MLMIILNKLTAVVAVAGLGYRDYLNYSNVDSIVKKPLECVGYKLTNINHL